MAIKKPLDKLKVRSIIDHYDRPEGITISVTMSHFRKDVEVHVKKSISKETTDNSKKLKIEMVHTVVINPEDHTDGVGVVEMINQAVSEMNVKEWLNDLK